MYDKIIEETNLNLFFHKDDLDYIHQSQLLLKNMHIKNKQQLKTVEGFFSSYKTQLFQVLKRRRDVHL